MPSGDPTRAVEQLVATTSACGDCPRRAVLFKLVNSALSTYVQFNSPSLTDFVCKT